MKLAVIGDIHSNHFALETCLDYVDTVKPDGLLFLGDYVTGCAYPEKTMKLLYHANNKYNCAFVRGNREEVLLDYHRTKTGWNYCSSSGSLLYTYENLTNNDFNFFESMKIAEKVEISGFPTITICHGSQKSTFDHLFLESKVLDDCLLNLDTDLLIGGHIHKTVNCTKYGKSYINPDSVGVAIAGKPEVRFGILHGENGVWIPEFKRLEYDYKKAAEEFETSGLIEKAKSYAKCMQATILTGRDYAYEGVVLATNIARMSGDSVNYYDLSEKYFEKAAKLLKII